MEEFWERWSNSYYQTLIKYHKWRLRFGNCEVGDVVLVLDKENPKGKFTIGIIDSVKVDDDGLVRKVTVKYKLSQSGEDLQLKLMKYKYAERNVRGLALLLTAAERKDLEKASDVNFDDVRFQDNLEEEESLHDDKSQSSEAPKDQQFDDEAEDVAIEEESSFPSKNDAARFLEPSSSGRKRFRPSRLDL